MAMDTYKDTVLNGQLSTIDDAFSRIELPS